MATNAFTPIRGKRIRVTELDECGRILPSARSMVTDGFVTVTLSPQVEDGTEITVRNANGAICVNERGNPSFTGFEVEIEFCEVNPSTVAMITNAREYENYGGDVAGFAVPEGEISGRFAFELWTGVAGVACGDEGDEASGYLLLPLVANGTIGDLEIGGEDAITFSLSNSMTKGGNAWGVGPFDVLLDGTGEAGVASPLPEPLDPNDHLLMVETFVAPPVSSVEPVTVTA